MAQQPPILLRSLRAPAFLALLALAGVLALLQALLLVRRSGRLVALRATPGEGAGAVLSLRFSRPVRPRVALLADGEGPASARSLPLEGEGRSWRLPLDPAVAAAAPLRLRISGRDQRNAAIPEVTVRWDPRPFLVALVARDARERLELRTPDGRWHPLSPWYADISGFWPMADGSGVVLTSFEGPLRHRAWRIDVAQASLWDDGTPAPTLQIRPPRDLLGRPNLFVHASSSLSGRLLLQGASLDAADPDAGSRPWIRLQEPGRRRWRTLTLESGGSAAMLPTGDGVILPVEDGLVLSSLPPLAPNRSFLPGRRDLSAFCGLGQRAVLLRREADYSRVIELLRPGLPPTELWRGSAAVVGVSCDAAAERIWLLSVDRAGERDAAGSPTQQLRLLRLAGAGDPIGITPLPGWELSGTSGLEHDPVSDRLLSVLRPPGREDGRAVLISLTPGGQPGGTEVLDRPILEAGWLRRRGGRRGISAAF
jgi:hypothetical protein